MLLDFRTAKAAGQVEKIAEFFSSGIKNKDLRERIKSIPSGKDPRFTTEEFAHFISDEKTAQIRVQATYDQKTGYWDLHKIIRFDLADETSSDLNGASKCEKIGWAENYFDALRFCSDFGKAYPDAQKHKIALLSGQYREIDGIPHWSVSAEDTGQAIDIDGTVQPCENGSALIGAPVFNQKQMKILASTLAVRALVKNFDEEFLFSSALSPSTDKAIGLINNAHDKKQEKSNYQTLIELGNSLVENFDETANENVSTSPIKFFWQRTSSEEKSAIVITGVATFGILPIWVIGKSYYKGMSIFPERRFSLLQKEFNKKAGSLLVEEDKKICREFAQITAYALWLERAKVEHRLATAKEKSVKSGLSYVKEAADALNLSKERRQFLEQKYLADGFAQQDFREIPRKLWASSEGLKSHLCNRYKALDI